MLHLSSKSIEVCPIFHQIPNLSYRLELGIFFKISKITSKIQPLHQRSRIFVNKIFSPFKNFIWFCMKIWLDNWLDVWSESVEKSEKIDLAFRKGKSNGAKLDRQKFSIDNLLLNQNFWMEGVNEERIMDSQNFKILGLFIDEGWQSSIDLFIFLPNLISSIKSQFLSKSIILNQGKSCWRM